MPRAESSRDLDVNCIEIANDPKELTDKLDDWETPYMVIPHGTTWGFYTPPNADWRKQLKDFYNPQTQNLLKFFQVMEIMKNIEHGMIHCSMLMASRIVLNPPVILFQHAIKQERLWNLVAKIQE